MAEKIIYEVVVDSKGAEKKVKSLNKEVKKTADESGKAGKSLSGGFKGMGDAIGGVIPMFGKLRAAIASTGIGAIVIAVAGLVSIFTSVGRKAAEFSKALSNLEAITGASASEMGELSDQAQKLGATTAFTASQVVELQTSLSKLGFKTDDIKNSTASILDLAAALGVGLGEAAEVAGSLVKSFGLETEDTQRIVDVMASAASNSALSFDTIRESMKMVAPVAKATGVSVEKTAALLGVLADNGVKGSMAGTGLSATFIELNKKGITLEEGMRKVTESSDPLGTAMELAGTRGGKALLTLTEGADGIDTLTESLENATGAARRQAEVQLDNVSGDVKILGSAWEGLLLSIDKGDGIISKVSRAFIQATTAILGFFTATKGGNSDLANQQDALFKLEAQLLDTNTTQEDRIKLIDELKRKHPKHTKNIDANTTSNEELRKSIEDINAALIDKIVLENADEELQEKINNAAAAKRTQIEEEILLRKQIADNAKKYGLTIIEGTLLEQAAAQKSEIAGKKDQERYIRQYKALGKGIDDVKVATDDYNEAQKDMSVLSEANNELKKQLGITTKKTTKTTEGEVVAKESLLDIQKKLLEDAKAMPETTEAEIRAKNKSIAVIEKEIKRLNALGVAQEPKKTKADKSETPAQKARREAEELKAVNEFNATSLEEERQLERDALKTEFEQLLITLGEDEAAKEELGKSFKERKRAQEAEFREEDLETQRLIDEEDLAAKQKKADDELALETDLANKKMAVQQEYVGFAGQIGNTLSSIAGDNEALATAGLVLEKGAAIAGVVINTSKSIAEQNASNAAFIGLTNAKYAGLPGGAIAAGVANAVNTAMTLKNITRTKIGAGISIASIAATSLASKGGTAPNVPAPSLGGDRGGATPQSPTFNLVGQSAATTGGNANNTQAQMDNADSNPIRSYVVSTDITSQQALDRDIESQGELG